VNIAEKYALLTTEKIPKVYDAGKNAVINDLKEAQKGTASGEVVKITDISTAQHNLSVQLSGDTVTDFSTVTLKAQGKNLFNNDISLLKKVVYRDANDAEYTRIGYEPLALPAGTYTFTLIDVDVFTKYIYGYIVGENNKIIRSCHLLNNTNNQTPKTITIGEGERVLIINGHAGLQMADRTKEFDAVKIQLEAGESATSYEEYKEPVCYTPNADGTVEGVKSIYPVITLTTDTSGVLIDAEYKKDINKSFDDYGVGVSSSLMI